MQDLFDKISRKMGPLGQHQKMAHGNYAFPILEGEIGPRMMHKGEECLVWSINNYLGLANHPEVLQTDIQGVTNYGLAYPMGSRMMSGNSNNHIAIEKDLAAFVGKQDALLLNFGYQGMSSAIDALVDRKDAIVYDAEVHACVIDGARLHLGQRYLYSHNDMVSFKKQLTHAYKWVESSGGSILVITEGVFGMSGDQGKLKEIIGLKDEYKFRLLVDDAHGFGTMGDTGAGTHEAQECIDEVDIYFGTFTKSMAGFGAFIASTEQITNYLHYNMRSQIFGKALSMPMVSGLSKRLELLKNPEFRKNLWEVSANLQNGLKNIGYNLGITNTMVTPVHLKCSLIEATVIIDELLDNYKIFCSLVTYPVIPRDMNMIRLIPTALHTLNDVNETLNAFAEIYIRHKKIIEP